MRLRSLVLTAAALVAAGCTDSQGPQFGNKPREPELKAVTQVQLDGEAGFALSEPVRVQLVDTLGAPIANETVTFQVVSGGGSVNPASATTDAGGIAATQWTLGATPGSNVLKASRGSSSVQVTANGAEGLGAAILKVSGGTTDSLPAGCTLLEPLVVKVLDKAGQPVAGATVNFTITSGDGSVATPTLKTGPDGMTSTKLRLGFQGGANVVRAELRTAARPSVEFSARSAPAAPNGYSVIGNKIFDPGTCAPILFHGAARPALESWYNADDEWAQFAQQAAALKGWGANLIRIPVSQSYWVPGTYWNGQATAAGVDYKAKVVDAVTKARALGLTVIVDLHSSDRGDKNYTGIPDIWKMPDVNHSVPFWRDVATTFKNDGGVLFELYNEPHPREDVWIDQQVDAKAWDIWRNGGVIEASKDYPCDECAVLPAYTAVGMQELYNVVRSTGAKNLVIVSGVHWGYSLQAVPQYRLDGYNIVYATHPYDWPDKQPDQFDKEFGFLTATDPVMVSEFGTYTCSANPAANTLGPEYSRRVMDYADAKGMSWVAWAFWSPRPVAGVDRAQQLCSRSALLADWNMTPSAAGQAVKDRLGSYK
ncbi:MAG: Endoglucanase precursor [Gemmatimonadetes bacterium]|nr:Endoglucanase precursor [Gemmatimonadota bacterium]